MELAFNASAHVTHNTVDPVQHSNDCIANNFLSLNQIRSFYRYLSFGLLILFCKAISPLNHLWMVKCANDSDQTVAIWFASCHQCIPYPCIIIIPFHSVDREPSAPSSFSSFFICSFFNMQSRVLFSLLSLLLLFKSIVMLDNRACDHTIFLHCHPYLIFSSYWIRFFPSILPIQWNWIDRFAVRTQWSQTHKFSCITWDICNMQYAYSSNLSLFSSLMFFYRFIHEKKKSTKNLSIHQKGKKADYILNS